MSKLTSIRIFCCAADTLNFSRAAEHLDCSAAMVSKHISGLEEHLGVRLFTRSTRRIRLTEEGQRYYRQCRKLLESLDDIEARLRCDKQAPAGCLRVSFPMDFGVDVLTPLLADFLEQYPDIQIDSVYEDRYVDLIAEGFDLAIRIGSQLSDSSLIATRLGSIHPVLCATPGYLESHPAIREARDLEDHNCIHWARAAEKSTWRFVGPDGEVQARVGGNLRTNNGRAMLLAALNGLGVTVLPLFLASRYLRQGLLVQVLPDHAIEPIGIYALYAHQAYLPARVRAFIDYLKQALGRLNRDTGLPASPPVPDMPPRRGEAGRLSPRWQTRP